MVISFLPLSIGIMMLLQVESVMQPLVSDFIRVHSKSHFSVLPPWENISV